MSEKITTPYESIMIDPNEPLILPDGTAITGRLEWFLYALCCLDYGNLPTPLSRIEVFANALITGELPDIEPQSRSEKFFFACLTGDISDLPEPQSRSEVLLNKLATGQYDLSDVEPIQSRYELLLAYLIKNGGISNVDYVLHRFAETVRTMYNTEEAPLKELLLSGNTEINVLQESVVDDYVPYGLDECYNGTITETTEVPAKHFTLHGDTKVNVLQDNINEDVVIPYTHEKAEEIVLTNTKSTGRVGTPIIEGQTVVNMVQEESDIEYTPMNKEYSGQTIFVKKQSSTNNTSGINGGTFTNVLPEPSIRNEMANISMQKLDEGVADNIVFKDGEYKSAILSGNTLLVDELGNECEIPNSPKITMGAWLDTNTGAETASVTSFNTGFLKCPTVSFVIKGNNKYKRIVYYDKNKSYIRGVDKGIGDNTIIIIPSYDIPTNAVYMRISASINKSGVSYTPDVNLFIEDENGNNLYITHLESVKMPVLTTTGKNLFNLNEAYDDSEDNGISFSYKNTGVVLNGSRTDKTLNSTSRMLNINHLLKPGKTYSISSNYEEEIVCSFRLTKKDGSFDYKKTFEMNNQYSKANVYIQLTKNTTIDNFVNSEILIQLEESSSITPYEPYKSNILTVNEDIELRGIGDVQDELNLLTGEVTERIGEIVLDGSDDEDYGTNWNDDRTAYPILSIYNNMKINAVINCDKVKHTSNGIYHSRVNEIAWHANVLVLLISNEDTNGGNNVTGLKEYLSKNPITIQYQLATESIKTVDLTTVNQDGTAINKPIAYKDGYIQVSSEEGSLLPSISYEIPTTNSYYTDNIKANTIYTFKKNEKDFTPNFTLGGTSYTMTNSFTSTVSGENQLIINSDYVGESDKVALIEGNHIGLDIPYFEGTKYFDYEPDKIKGVTLEGQTLVNVIQELSEEIKYVIGNGEVLSGQSVTIEQDVKGLEGQTLVNLWDNSGQHSIAPNNFVRQIRDCFKKSTKYLLKYNVLQTNTNNSMIIQYYHNGTWIVNEPNYSKLNEDYDILTTPSVDFNGIRIFYDSTFGTETVILEDIMLLEYQEGMENWNIPYFEGTKYFDYSTPRYINGATLEGQTLVNLVQDKTLWFATGNTSNYTNIVNESNYISVETIANLDSWSTITCDVQLPMLKPNTKYLVKFDGCKGHGLYLSIRKKDGTKPLTNEQLVTTSTNYVILTTQSTLDIDSQVFYVNIPTSTPIGTQIVVSKPRIIEYQEGMEDWDIPYFEGMKSVQMPILTTTGKNLFDINKINTNYNNYNNNTEVTVENNKLTMVSKSDGRSYISQLEPLYLKPNTEYTFSITGSSTGSYKRVHLGTNQGVDSNQYKTIVFSEVEETKNVTFTTDDTGYLFIHFYPSTSSIATSIFYNMQLEEGSTATSYEPYKSNTLTVNEEVELRGVGDVQDTLDLMTGELTERIGEVVLDGSESWWQSGNTTETKLSVGINFPSFSPSSPIICNDLPNMTNTALSDYGIMYDEEKALRINVPKTIAQNVEEFKQWLNSKNLIIYGKLEQPTIKTVDLHIINQDNKETPQLQLQTPINHITTSSDALIPVVNIPSTINYDTIIKPSTRYTLRFNQDEVNTDNPLTVNLGGTEQIVSGNNFTMITPSTLTHNQLQLSGKGNVVSKVQVIKGDVTNIEYPFFEGMNDVKFSDGKFIATDGLYRSVEVQQEVPQEIVLRGIGDVKDELDLTKGEYIQRIDEVVFDGSNKGWHKEGDLPVFYLQWNELKRHNDYSSIIECDKLPVVHNPYLVEPTVISFSGYVNDVKYPDENWFYIVTDMFSNANELIAYLQLNPITVQYVLATPIIHKVNLTNFNKIPLYATETHYETVTPSDSLIPNITIPSTLNYDVAIKPSTKYTIRANTSDNLTVDLGGTTETLINGKVTLTTPATLTHNEIKFSGTGKVKELMVVEGKEIKDNVMFFNGMKNIEIGSGQNILTVTGNETDKYQILSTNEEIALRSLPNGVCDTLNLVTGEYVQRVGEIVLNGNNNQFIGGLKEQKGDYLKFGIQLNPVATNSHNVYSLNDRFNSETYSTSKESQQEQIYIHAHSSTSTELRVCILPSRLSTPDEVGFNSYLQSNPITVQYELATPIIHKLNISNTDQDGNQQNSIIATNDYMAITTVNDGTNSIKYEVSLENDKYDALIKPSTKYTIVANKDVNGHDLEHITYNLGGTTVTSNFNTRKVVITTPATLEHENLIITGGGAKVGEVMIVEGDIEDNFGYFEGMSSVKNPVLTTTGKNLVFLDKNNPDALGSDSGNGTNAIRYDDEKQAFYTDTHRSMCSNMRFKPNTYYIISAEFLLRAGSSYSFNWQNPQQSMGTTYSDNTPFNETRWVRKSIKRLSNNNGKIDWIVYWGVWFRNLQIEEAESLTEYEPYQSNILTVNEPVELRGIGDVKDELNLLTGELVQRFHKITIDESYDWVLSEEINGYLQFTTGLTVKGNEKGQLKGMSNGFVYGTLDGEGNQEQVMIYDHDGWITQLRLMINSSRLESPNLSGFKKYIANNQFELIYTQQPTVKTVDLHIINQDNNIIDSMYTFENITHVSTDADGIKPTVSSPNALEYSVVIKPNTQYTIFNSDNSSLLSYNLGGSYGNNSDEKVLITTPSALTSNTLRIERSGLKVSDLMVLEGNKKIIPYIEGMANASIKQIITTTNDDANKTTVLSFKNGLNLAKIGKNEDIFDVNNNILRRKIGKITLNGSENWEVSDDTTTNTVRYVAQEIIKDNPISTELYGVAHGANYESIYNIDREGVILTNPNGHCYFRSTIRDLEQFKAWLQENPVTIQYVLANEINESVEYTIVDQNGSQVEKISSFDGSTNFKVVLDENSVNPLVEAEVKAKNRSTMNEISLAHEEINEAQRDIDDGINTQTNETDSTMMATTEIFENSL